MRLGLLGIAAPLLLFALLSSAVGAHRDAIGGGSEWSFPSGNAMVSMALAVAAVVLLAETRWRRHAIAIGAGLVLLEGAWLVVIQWHYPSDVVGGWLIAIAWVSALALSGLGATGGAARGSRSGPRSRTSPSPRPGAG